MLGLRKAKNAPFLREHGLDSEKFVIPQQLYQGQLDLPPAKTPA